MKACYGILSAMCVCMCIACSKPSPGTPVTITINPITDSLMKLPIKFSATVYPDVESYLWNFGDGTTSTETSPSHTYQDMGTYNISCIVYRLGVAHTATGKVLVKGDPRLVAPRHFSGTSTYINNFQTPNSVTRNLADTIITFTWYSPFSLNGMIWNHDNGTEVQYQTSPVATSVYEYLRFYPANDSVYIFINLTGVPGSVYTSYSLASKK